MVHGQAVVDWSVNTDTTINGPKTETNTSWTYQHYNDKGQLIGVDGRFHRTSTRVDLARLNPDNLNQTAGSTTSTGDFWGDTKYIIRHGQPLTVESRQTGTNSSDLGKQLDSSSIVTRLHYNALDQLEGSQTVSNSVSNTANDDGTWSQSYSRTTSDSVIVNGELQSLPSTTVSFSPDEAGGAFVSATDRFTDSIEGVLASAKSILDYAKAHKEDEAALKSKLSEISAGTIGWNQMTTTYNALGQVTGGYSSSLSGSNKAVYTDKNRNLRIELDSGEYTYLQSFSESAADYGVQKGSTEVKFSWNNSQSFSPAESSKTYTETTSLFLSNGTLKGGTGWSNTTTKSKVYNSESRTYSTALTYTDTSETYGAAQGRLVLLRRFSDTQQDTKVAAPDEHSWSSTTYTVGLDGRTLSAAIWTRQYTHVFNDPDGDGHGNYAAKNNDSSATQTFTTLGGSSLIKTQTNSSTVNNQDGSYDSQGVTTTYNYDGYGRLFSASAGGTTHSNDGDGRDTTGTLTQDFVVINGQAMINSSRSISDTTGKSTTRSDVTTQYGYNADGVLTSSSGRGNSSGTNGWQNGVDTPFSTEIYQTYAIRKGQAVLLVARNVTTTWPWEAGLSLTNVNDSSISYGYDAKNRLISAVSSGTTRVTSPDGRVPSSGLQMGSPTFRDSSFSDFRYWMGDSWGDLPTEIDASGRKVVQWTGLDTTSETILGKYLTGTGSSTQKFGIFYGLAKVLRTDSSTNTTTSQSVQRNFNTLRLSYGEKVYKALSEEGVPYTYTYPESPLYTWQTNTDVVNVSNTAPSSSWEISAYDGNGKYIGVSASHMEGFRPGFGYYTNDRTNTGHDSNHNATGYIEHSWNEGNGFSDTTRSDIVYNDRNSTYSYNDSFSKNGGDAATAVVNSTTYNDLGLETSKNMTVSWGNSHYGLVSGLSDGLKGWQNGTATLTTNTEYDSLGRVSATNTSGLVAPWATNADLADSKGYQSIVFSGFLFSSSQSNMQYDHLGRMTSNTYVNVSPGARRGPVVKRRWPCMNR